MLTVEIFLHKAFIFKKYFEWPAVIHRQQASDTNLTRRPYCIANDDSPGPYMRAPHLHFVNIANSI